MLALHPSSLGALCLLIIATSSGVLAADPPLNIPTPSSGSTGSDASSSSAAAGATATPGSALASSFLTSMSNSAASNQAASPFSGDASANAAAPAAAAHIPSIPYTGAKSGTCSVIGERKEIRALTPTERQKFFAALQKIKASGVYETFTQFHLDNSVGVHNHASFLPWHRVYVRSFELALQAVDPTVWLPYWEWPLDSQAPEQSAIFTSAFFGGNGKGADNCVQDGPFANWQMKFPKPHCLRRIFRRGTTCGTFHAPESINRIITQSTSYDNFRQNFENVPHAGPHLGIGGDMQQMESPNDPLFWLHHSYVDKVYYLWQKARPELANTYSGRAVSSVDHTSKVAATLQDKLSPFPYIVQEALSTTALCYTYPELQISDLGEQAVPPATQGALNATDASLTKITPNANFTTPFASDRTSLLGLRAADPVEKDWNKMNGNNATSVTRQELEYMSMIDQLNALEGYVSPAALWHRPALMAQVIASVNTANPGTPAGTIAPTPFYADIMAIGRVQAFWNLGVEVNQAVANIRARIMTAANNKVEFPTDQIRAKLEAIIGPMIAVESISAAGNPFGYAPVNPNGTSTTASSSSSLRPSAPLALLLFPLIAYLV